MKYNYTNLFQMSSDFHSQKGFSKQTSPTVDSKEVEAKCRICHGDKQVKLQNRQGEAYYEDCAFCEGTGKARKEEIPENSDFSFRAMFLLNEIHKNGWEPCENTEDGLMSTGNWWATFKNKDEQYCKTTEQLISKYYPSPSTTVKGSVVSIEELAKEILDKRLHSENLPMLTLEVSAKHTAEHLLDKYSIQPLGTVKEEESQEVYFPCGGCGATTPRERCIGCWHPFTQKEKDQQQAERDKRELWDKALTEVPVRIHPVSETFLIDNFDLIRKTK